MLNVFDLATVTLFTYPLLPWLVTPPAFLYFNWENAITTHRNVSSLLCGQVECFVTYNIITMYIYKEPKQGIPVLRCCTKKKEVFNKITKYTEYINN